MHKLRAEEVLLSTWTEPCPGRFVITARWPKGHAFYRPSQGAYDPLLLAETVRQGRRGTRSTGRRRARTTRCCSRRPYARRCRCSPTPCTASPGSTNRRGST
ncbi:AfsA-related hotdog domain-containing protein [Streptomyces cavourensis]|uniref:AfsA-related hotdog domain-containing protein n=1 Tax=Streptomyces cavourensis TaxID=67258 RepID=UPI0020C9569D|nr:AfsA-related hotdog domain-containing protein [Streptomyces cavourensis]